LIIYSYQMDAPHPFTLRQLQYAAAVAETLSFHRAAERCAVSQPALSAQLAHLERALGVRLFERDRRRVLPTRPGTELVERARRVLLAADDLLDAAKERRDPLAGTLRIGVIPTISPYLLPLVSPRLRKAFPRLTITWMEEKTEVLTARLEDGGLDAALLALEADLPDLAADVIASDPFVLAAPKGHPLAKEKGPVRVSDLEGASVLLLDDGHCFREQALAVCGKAKASELAFRATSLATLVQMVSGGAGVTLLPALAAPTEAKRADLVIRPFQAPAPHRTIALVHRRQSPLAPALGQVAGVIRSSSSSRPSSPPASRTRPPSRPRPSGARRPRGSPSRA
jgi:LysR family hydrogen peroxide-inducible transcriptional activator